MYKHIPGKTDTELLTLRHPVKQTNFKENNISWHPSKRTASPVRKSKSQCDSDPVRHQWWTFKFSGKKMWAGDFIVGQEFYIILQVKYTDKTVDK